MITVRLFGLLSQYDGPRQFSIEAKTVREALNMAAGLGVDKELLRGAAIFINNQPLTGARRFGRALRDGDELALLTPAGGG